MSIFDLKAGESGVISEIKLPANAMARLSSLGFSRGKKVTVLAFSLFKSAVLVSCGAVRVGMRAQTAKNISIISEAENAG